MNSIEREEFTAAKALLTIRKDGPASYVKNPGQPPLLPGTYILLDEGVLQLPTAVPEKEYRGFIIRPWAIPLPSGGFAALAEILRPEDLVRAS